MVAPRETCNVYVHLGKHSTPTLYLPSFVLNSPITDLVYTLHFHSFLSLFEYYLNESELSFFFLLQRTGVQNTCMPSTSDLSRCSHIEFLVNYVLNE